MDFLPQHLSAYAENHSTAEPTLLAELNRETWSKVLMPRMLSGHLQGRFLSMISHLIQPKRILEIGTYTGYSALCMAEGLAPEGELHTIDINEELEPMIRNFFEKSDFADRLHLHIGNAKDIIPTLEGPFDLVFIDADKENYSQYFDLVIDRMSKGGLIVADNVLWSGKVTDVEALAKDEETAALDAFNKKVHLDPRVEHVLLPLRDGLMMARKK